MVANFSSAWGLRVSSIWASDSVLSSSSSSACGWVRRSTMSSSSSLVAGLGLVGDLFLFLDRGAGDLLADLALRRSRRLPRSPRSARRSGPCDSIASRSRISRSCMRPSLRALDQPMIALKVIGLSHRPQIMMSRPASMRLAIAISPSRESNSTAPISRRYMRTGSSVRSTASFLTAAAGRGPPSSSGSTSSSAGSSSFSSSSSSSDAFGALDDVDAHVVERGHHVLDLLATTSGPGEGPR